MKDVLNRSITRVTDIFFIPGLIVNGPPNEPTRLPETVDGVAAAFVRDKEGRGGGEGETCVICLALTLIRTNRRAVTRHLFPSFDVPSIIVLLLIRSCIRSASQESTNDKATRSDTLSSARYLNRWKMHVGGRMTILIPLLFGCTYFIKRFMGGLLRILLLCFITTFLLLYLYNCFYLLFNAYVVYTHTARLFKMLIFNDSHFLIQCKNKTKLWC